MKKKILALSLISLIIMLYASVSMVNANNSSDTRFRFMFFSDMYNTELRPKTDTTSSYMSCESTPYSYRAHVYTFDGAGNTVDCSYGHYYVFNAGTTRYLINNVKENGYSSSGIMGKRLYYGVAYSATGLWSPDSV